MAAAVRAYDLTSFHPNPINASSRCVATPPQNSVTPSEIPATCPSGHRPCFIRWVTKLGAALALT